MPSTTLAAPAAARGSVPPTFPGNATPAPGLARLPAVLIGVLFAYLLLPRVWQQPELAWCFAGVATALLAWFVALRQIARRRGRPLLAEYVKPVKQHYIQAAVQGSVYAYWGWFWTPIYTQIPLILSQLVFAFAFDALLAWSRGRAFRLTSGPFPIVLSTNLFIWFVDTWFVLQFAMIATALLGKEFVKWTKDGRRTHIFNPSGFGLLVAAIALIATRTTDDVSLARPLANTIDDPPLIFAMIFAIGLVVQRFFAVTLMTLCAGLVIVAMTLGYHAWTGVYLFTASNLPAAGFLGMHLLMTDPSTSPKTNVGKALFGAGYGFLYATLFNVLGAAGNLELYAKLFPVPLLNLSVRALDRFATTGPAGRWNRAWESALPAARMNLAHMGVWSAFFATLYAAGYFARPHPGSSIEFWKRAAAEGRPQATGKLAVIAIGNASGDALNEMGLLSLDPEFMRLPGTSDRPSKEYWFTESMSRGSIHGARNLVLQFLHVDASFQGPYLAAALQLVRGDAEMHPGGVSSLLMGFACEHGRGVPLDAARAAAFYRACRPDDVLAAKGLARLALRSGAAPSDTASVVAVLRRHAGTGDAESAWYLAHLLRGGCGVPADDAEARRMLQSACDLGLPQACEALRAPALPPFAPLDQQRTARPAWSTAFPL